jgi:hypothetical protein
MSLMETGSTGDSGSVTDCGSTEGQTIDSLNQQFQDSTGKEGQGGQSDVTDNSNAASWFYDENMPGQGERPEWLKDKYKSAADQAKAYNELDKKLGKFQGAPENYSTEIPDAPDFKFEEGDPMLADFLKMAKEANASQDFVTNVLNHYVKTNQFYAPDPEQEMQKIGVNAKQEINQLREWASQRLTSEEMQVFGSMVTTAESFQVLQKLRRAATSTPEIAVDKNTNAIKGNAGISERQLNEMIADPRFNTDPLFRKEVEAHAQKIWG